MSEREDKYPIVSVEEAIDDFKSGRFVIIVDDEDR